MAKGTNNVAKKRTHSSKPYDVSNSFVKQVANRVSNLLPQTSWLNRWLAPATPTAEDDCSQSNPVMSEDDDDICNVQPPPTKRARIPLNQTFPADSFRISSTIDESAEFNSRERAQRFQEDNEQAGPSGLSSFSRSRLVSSTPATQLTSSTSIQHDVIVNGDDRSDSGESTSGCSSLVPQGNRQSYSNETTNFSNRPLRRASIDERDFSSYLQSSRSLFPNRASPRLNTTLNTRQGPTFNASLYTLPFATRSPSSDKSHSSPFYPGPTTYGGASAYRKRRNGFFSPNEILPVTQSIQVKPVNRSDSSELSSVTARRILDTLDELSSPVRDAKRVPLAMPSGQKRRAEDVRPRSQGPPTQDLTIPTVPDLLRLHRRMKLQDTLESARLIACSPAASQSPVNSEYRLRLQQDVGKHTGKMSSRTRDVGEEMSEDVYLPNIALPITSLPKFDFMLPERSEKGFNLSTASDLSSLKLKTSPIPTPISMGKPCAPSSKKSNPFTCVSGTQSPVVSTLNFIPSCPSKVNSPSPQTRLKEKSPRVNLGEGNGPVEKSGFGIGVAEELKSGSVMDILGKKESTSSIKPPVQSLVNAFKHPLGSWECDCCLVRNKSEVAQCMSCRTPRLSAKTPVSSNITSISSSSKVTTSNAPAVPALTKFSGFGDQFKPPVGTWQCQACMVQNKPETSSCISCTTAKAGPKLIPKADTTSTGFGNKFKPAGDTWECVTCMVRNKAALEFCAACEGKKPGSANNLPVPLKQTSGFGNMFKKPEGSWECPDCMVLNKEVVMCVACGALKTGTAKEVPAIVDTSKEALMPNSSGFGDMFKLPEGSWECPDCMLVNKDVWKCVACEATKPGISGFGDMFKKPAGSWECSECMVPNTNVLKCVACETPKPGTVKTSIQPAPTIKFNFEIPPEASTFKFGIDKAGDSAKITETANTSKPSAVNFQFGAPSSSGGTGGFTFGNPTSKSSTAEVTAGFTFGNGISPAKTAAKSETNVPPPAVFSFGALAAEKISSEKKPEVSENGKIGANLAGKDTDLQSFSIGKSAYLPGSNTTEANKNQSNNIAKPSFSFGSSKSNMDSTKTTEIAPILKFGGTSSSLPAPIVLVASSVNVNGPTVVAPATTTSSVGTSGLLFGGTTNSTSPTTITPKALFGTGTAKPSPSFGGFSTIAAPSFGQPATTVPSSTPVFGTQSKPVARFSFVSPTSVGQKRSCNDDDDRVPGGKKQAIGFTSLASTTSSNIFGSSAITTTTVTTSDNGAHVLSFGSNTKSTVPSFNSSTAPPFGASFSSGSADSTGAADKPVAAATPFVFGSGSGVAPPPAYTFPTKQDGTLPVPTATFGFGSAAPVTGGFNFTSQSSEKPAGFGFGSTPAAPFGNVSAVVAPVFGSTPVTQPPAYTSPSAGFNFGGSSQPPASGVFSFSANTPAPAFTFGQAATPATAPTFDPNARPSFNFTGGEIPQFTAAGASVQPSTGARRIKKAVRRAPR